MNPLFLRVFSVSDISRLLVIRGRTGTVFLCHIFINVIAMKMRKIIYVLLATLILNAAHGQKPAVVPSDKTGWHKIGETTVDFKNEKDEILVVGANRFASLKFKVDNAPIEISNIEVIFEEGDSQNIKVMLATKSAGEETREVELKGAAERSIKKIVFYYKTLANRQDKKAHVEIWGRKSNAVK
jgi:hypothetical protein